MTTTAPLANGTPAAAAGAQSPLPPVAVPPEVADPGRIRIGAAVGGRAR